MPMWPATLPDRPHSTNFSDTQSQSFDVMETDAGIPVVRRIRRGVTNTIVLSWEFTRPQFDAFEEFFNDDLEDGTLSFTMPTWGMFDSFTFGASPYSVTSLDGDAFAVTANLISFS